MITEDYVSFETAKLLKEKGFCLSTKTAYNQQGIFNLCEGFTNGVKSLCNADFDRYYNSDFISAPTLQMAMKWLREIHKIDVWVECHSSNRRYKGYIHSEQRGDEALFYEDSYEKACEAAIKHCLENLI